ncbi:transmembrane amino acid transporter protein-domain-containing protein [Immersiella caudata]|uniref:Transmembrane amino acid transporter protein-domain-containing protein n=1 Tax=Immersiella caudata TaxID=314043 RepID=A0AA39WPV9_9PEZI|nr:transmembrane amino acid transporter protein-domain-containing protein [Immersiella caudata]
MSRGLEDVVSAEKPGVVEDSTPAHAGLDDFWSFSSIFGGKGVKIGPRIGPLLHSDTIDISSGDESTDAILTKQRELEDGNAIQYRTCSWQKTAALLFSEYICLATMSFPWSYSILGLVPGLILTFFVAGIVLYTSLVLWEFCLRHPEVRDVCDIGQMLFWNKKWAWYATAAMFLLNNTFIQALHVLVGVKYLDTVTSAGSVSCRPVVYGVIVMLVCWLSSLPRTFNMLSKLGTASALFTFISVVLAAAFAGAQRKPAGFDPLALGEPIVTAFPVAGTTFVAALNAFLNISYTFIGQITLPSFIAEMEDPRDFPKALWACTIAEIIVFSIVGGVVYAYTGNQYMTAPAFGSLTEVYKKVAFSFMIPTIIFLGVLYASVSARFVFFRIFHNSRHKSEHTVIGWASWAGILLATWILAFVIAEVIPFFSYLLSLMSSLFDSFFGFIFWGVAYFRMRNADGKLSLLQGQSVSGYILAAFNVFIILIGVFFLTLGTYASVEGIIEAFEAGNVGSAFTCTGEGL